MPEHSTILSSNCHEPKHITGATTADAGKIITPSAGADGVSELRAIVPSDISGLTATMQRASAAKIILNNTTPITFATDASSDEFLELLDYKPVSGLYTSVFVDNLTTGPDSYKINVQGIYNIWFEATVRSSVAGNRVGANFSYDGSLSSGGVVKVETPVANKPYSLCVHALGVAGEDMEIAVYMAAALASDITITVGRFYIQLVGAIE